MAVTEKASVISAGEDGGGEKISPAAGADLGSHCGNQSVLKERTTEGPYDAAGCEPESESAFYRDATHQCVLLCSSQQPRGGARDGACASTDEWGEKRSVYVCFIL